MDHKRDRVTHNGGSNPAPNTPSHGTATDTGATRTGMSVDDVGSVYTWALVVLLLLIVILGPRDDEA